jgi:hypothetical protein
MYNRYVPQADGSHRKNRVQEQRPQPPPHPTPPPQQERSRQETPPCSPPPLHPPQNRPPDAVPDFLRQLLPRDFDTGDLIVILLLLLLAGDCEADRSTALLTLVLYLFM